MDDDQYCDPLYAGLTRPAMVFGVPVEGVIIGLGIAFLPFLLMPKMNVFVLLFYLPIHVALYLLCKTNPWAPKQVIMWLKTYGKGAKTSRDFGGDYGTLLKLSPEVPEEDGKRTYRFVGAAKTARDN